MYALLLSFKTRLIVLASILAYLSFSDSSTHDEPAHFASGIYDWQVGSFDLYYVNPPLTRMVAAFPASLAFDSAEFADPSTLNPLKNWGGGAGSQLWRDHGVSAEYWLSIGRCLLIPAMLLGLWYTEQFAKNLYGDSAAALSGWLYVICPNMLAAGHSVAADGTCAALLVVACYAFHRWLKSPNWWHCVQAGWLLGFALLTKTVVIFAPILFVIAWLAVRICKRSTPNTTFCPINDGQCLAIIIISLSMLNAGYGFRGSFTKLGDFEFVSHSLTGLSGRFLDHAGERSTEISFPPGNRFRNGWLGKIPVPFPSPYVYGIDRQKRDFEISIPTYIQGKWGEGRWYHQLLAALIKMPTGTLGLLALAILFRFIRLLNNKPVRESIVIWLMLGGLLAVNLSQPKMTIFFRYMVPCLPLLFIWISAVVESHPDKKKETSLSGHRYPRGFKNATSWLRIRCSWLLLVLSGLSVCFSLPYVIAYSNYWFGGPWRGSKWYIGTNEYGQNLWRIKSKLNQIPRGDHIFFCSAYHQKLSNTLPGKYEHIPSTTAITLKTLTPDALRHIRSGWYIATQYDVNPPIESIGSSWLSRFEPVQSIAPGLYLYYLSDHDIQSLYSN